MRRHLLVAPLLALALAAQACSSASDVPEVDVNLDTTGGVPGADDEVVDGDAPDGDQGDEGDAPTAEPSATATAEDDPAASEPAPAASSAPPTSAPPASTPPSSAPPADEATLRPVPAGTYTYETVGTSKLGENPERELPPRTTLIASTAGSDDIQQQVRDLRDADGYGSRNTTTLRYGVQGVVLLSSQLESTVDLFGSPFTQQTDLEADPPALIAPHAFEVGSRAGFHLVGDEVEVDGTMVVVREERLTVGGTAVDTYVVEVQYVLTGAIEGTSNATWWVRPADLLVVKERSDTDVESRGLRYQEQYEAVLVGLQPA